MESTTPPANVASKPLFQGIKGISSMATKQLLAELTQLYAQTTGQTVEIESVGGVDAAKRVQGGEAFDIVLLASDAIDKLVASGHLHPTSRVDWVCSTVAIAVRTGTPHPDVSSEAALQRAVAAASTLSYSTGPSGTYLTQLFERWGMTQALQAKIIQPPPGTPVGSLVASGQVTLGFQQLSELISVPGIDVLGNLPAEVAFITTFSSGIPAHLTGTALKAAQGFQAFLASQALEPTKRAQGMYWSS